MSEQVDQKSLDVIVIGAGPAGGQCARELAGLGRRVVLVERSQEIGEPNYSTAGTPNETVADFNLPPSVLSATWDRIYFESKNAKAEWKFESPRGFVFDFAALRKFLAEDAARHGADIMIGATVTDFIYDGDDIVGVKIKGVLGDSELRAPIIVDATGHWCWGNSKLQINKPDSQDMVSAIELQMSGMPQGFANTLAFFVGSTAPQGYAWIFPMENNQAAKLGIGAYGQLPQGQELKSLLKNFLNKFESTKHLEPTEVHGGGGFISPTAEHHVHKNIILIGDAAYQVNALAYEGIRHALKTGRLAAQVINNNLSAEGLDEDKLKNNYEKVWRQEFGRRWQASYEIAKVIYHDFTDEDWDTFLRALQSLTADEAFEVFFNYRYELLLKHPMLAIRLAKWAPLILKSAVKT